MLRARSCGIGGLAPGSRASECSRGLNWRFERTYRGRGGHDPDADAKVARGVHVVGAALGVMLLEDGWRAFTRPGLPIFLVRGSQSFDPIGTVRGLAESTLAAADWRAECHALGISGRPLARSTARVVVGAPAGAALADVQSARSDVAPRLQAGVSHGRPLRQTEGAPSVDTQIRPLLDT